MTSWTVFSIEGYQQILGLLWEKSEWFKWLQYKIFLISHDERHDKRIHSFNVKSIELASRLTILYLSDFPPLLFELQFDEQIHGLSPQPSIRQQRLVILLVKGNRLILFLIDTNRHSLLPFEDLSHLLLHLSPFLHYYSSQKTNTNQTNLIHHHLINVMNASCL